MIGLYVLITHGLYIWLAVWATKKMAYIVATRTRRIAGYNQRGQCRLIS